MFAPSLEVTCLAAPSSKTATTARLLRVVGALAKSGGNGVATPASVVGAATGVGPSPPGNGPLLIALSDGAVTGDAGAGVDAATAGVTTATLGSIITAMMFSVTPAFCSLKTSAGERP